MNFDEIMAFGKPANQLIFDQLRDEIKANIVTPFIGAGLSKSVGYPLWREALARLCEFTEPKKRQAITEQIGIDPEYAADLIEASIGPRNMHQYIDRMFGGADGINTRGHSIGLIPYLFPSQLVLTTNYDRVIERSYQQINNVIMEWTIPSNLYHGRQLLAGVGLPGLYKVHGDVKAEYDDIVFSRASYNRHYNGDTEVTRALSAYYIGRRILFLGCSLQNDRTLRLLQTLATEGTKHFAILDEDTENVWDRRKELSESYGIDAILYPKGQHDCLKMILERLLEEQNPEAFRTYAAFRSKSDPLTKRFVYTSLNTDFIGRENELEELTDFVRGDGRPVTWWALTGPGGSGKSRLVYELTQRVHKELDGWQVITYQRSETITPERLNQSVSNTPGNLVLVIDYMQTGLGCIAEWISSLHYITRQIRVLFLQREGADSLAQDLLPPWVREMLNARGYNRELVWKDKFLLLKPWSDLALIKQVMRSYAIHMNREGALETCLDDLCAAIQSTDERLLLPLYAMFIADATLEGKNPRAWNAKQLLDCFCTRERDFHTIQLEGIHNDLRGAVEDYEALLVLSTIINGWKAPETSEGSLQPFQNFWHFISNTLHLLDTQVIRKCEEFGILDVANGSRFKCVEPDPFGEFYVLWFFVELLKAGKNAVIQAVIQEALQNSEATGEFFARAFTDYGEYLDVCWNSIRDFLCSKGEIITTAFDFSIVRRMLDIVVDTNKGYLSISQIAMEKAGILYNLYQQNIGAAILYTRGLTNLTVVQEGEACAATVARQQTLWESFPHNEAIALEYAEGLFNLTVEPEGEACAATVARLQKLYEQSPDNAAIAQMYAMGMVNLCFVQGLEACTATVEQLRTLADHFSQNEAIVLRYARGLENLCEKQDVEEITSTVALIKSLRDRFPLNEEIANEFIEAQEVLNKKGK
ncbi:MAG: hypothetical protein GX418_11760 [Clostridiales bacterium]|nr:hypothetical protein [Clostridiales bacterium]